MILLQLVRIISNQFIGFFWVSNPAEFLLDKNEINSLTFALAHRILLVLVGKQLCLKTWRI